MEVRMIVATLVAVLSTACAAAPSAQPADSPAAFDPVGTYEFTAYGDGQAVGGTARISRNPDGTLAGTLSIGPLGTLPVNSVAAENGRITINATSGGAPLVMTFNVAGDQFDGEWRGMNRTGALSGTRR